MSEITAVIANFNYGRYLREAVDSALAEGAKVVVVDDGSTEPLPELPPVVEVVEQENQGVARARNVGIGLAETPYVIVLDADDRIVHGALSLLRDPLDADPKLGFAYGRMRFFGDWEGELRFPPYDPYALLYRHTIGLSALVRRQVLEDTGGFDPAFGQFEDWELWVNALAHGWRGRQIEAVTVDYRRHSGSSTGRPSGVQAGVPTASREARGSLPRLRALLGGELARPGRPPCSPVVLGAETDPGQRRAAPLRPALAPKGRPSTWLSFTALAR